MVDDFSLQKYWITYQEGSVDLDNEIKNSKVPLVLYFSAKWCGPCKLMAPMLEEKLEQNKNFKVIKIETDKYEDLAMDFEIQGLPTFYVYQNGAKVDTFMGSKEDLVDKLYQKISSMR
jgi:thioredoxin 1